MTRPNVRPFKLERDLTSYVAYQNSLAASKGEPQEFTEAAQRAQAEMLADADILVERFVAEVGGAVVGFAEVWKVPQTLSTPLMIEVHPEWQNRVGRNLLTRASERAKSLGGTALLAYAKPSDENARAFFTENNFVAVSGYRTMCVELRSKPAKPGWSEGLSVLPYTEVDQPHLHSEASHKGWSDLWGHTIPTEKTTAATLEAYSPEGIFLLFSEGEVVGVCKAKASEDGEISTGEVDAPGVAPDYRSEVNYRNLLLEALRWLYERGQQRVTLESWGELDVALAAYESLGEHALGYALPL